MRNLPETPTNGDPVPEAHDVDGMTPTDFVLWLNGALDVLDRTPPTQEQWDTMREKIAGQVGAIVNARIRHAAEPDRVQAQAARSYGAAPLTAANPPSFQHAAIDLQKAKLQAYHEQLNRLLTDQQLKKQLADSAMSAVNFGAAVKKS